MVADPGVVSKKCSKTNFICDDSSVMTLTLRWLVKCKAWFEVNPIMSYAVILIKPCSLFTTLYCTVITEARMTQSHLLGSWGTMSGKHILFSSFYWTYSHIYCTYSVTHRHSVSLSNAKYCTCITPVGWCYPLRPAWFKPRWKFKRRQEEAACARCIAFLRLNCCIASIELLLLRVAEGGVAFLLSGQDYVQVGLDVVDGVAQVLAELRANVVLVQTEGGWTGLVHEGKGLLTQTTATSKVEAIKIQLSACTHFDFNQRI